MKNNFIYSMIFVVIVISFAACYFIFEKSTEISQIKYISRVMFELYDKGAIDVGKYIDLQFYNKEPDAGKNIYFQLCNDGSINMRKLSYLSNPDHKTEFTNPVLDSGFAEAVKKLIENHRFCEFGLIDKDVIFFYEYPVMQMTGGIAVTRNDTYLQKSYPDAHADAGTLSYEAMGPGMFSFTGGL